ncbi:hypothetical protein PMIN02_001068 [Paraphaeosphaeria minitans]
MYPDLFIIDLNLEANVTGHDCAPGQLRPLDTGSDHCHSLAARWILDCYSTHEDCRARDQGSWLPTRLIDVGHNWPAVEPRLVVTFDLPKQIPAPLYTSLSHLWAAETVLRLTTENQNQLMRALPMDDLSPTFRDAIMFTRRLGMRFIWIDSLCILQDSPEDWMAESSVMNRVYKHSVCNIAATTVSYRSPGLYKRRDPRMVTPYKTRIQRSGHKRPYVYSLGGDTYHRAVSRADINSRVWVFQERMLSPRTLHFSTQLFWECRMLHACETYPTGFPRVPTSAGFDSDPPWSNCKLWMKDLQTDATSTWQSLVQTYCTSHFTQQRDRLAALAGLVQEIHTYTNDEYLAGLWKKELPHALCWMLYGTLQSSDITRANEYRCPSWSWASLNFSGNHHLRFLDGTTTHRYVTTVLDANVQSSSGNVYSNITGGYVRLQGKLGRIRLDRLQNANWRGDRGGHYTYEFAIDVGGPSHEDMEDYQDPGSVYCVPIASYDRANPGDLASIQVYCIVLEPVEGESMKFTRIGWMTVLKDWEEEVHAELRWVLDYACAQPQATEGLDILTMV